MAEKIISPRFSLQGYSFKEWLKGNWPTIKEWAKVGTPLVMGWLATKDPFWTGVVTLTGKYLLDLIQYYVNEKKVTV